MPFSCSGFPILSRIFSPTRGGLTTVFELGGLGHGTEHSSIDRARESACLSQWHPALPSAGFKIRSNVSCRSRVQVDGTGASGGRQPRFGRTTCEFRELVRSEEHTSELQSLTNLVCRLLLEKKKNRRCRNETNASGDYVIVQ